jgi:hypothetical protein
MKGTACHQIVDSRNCKINLTATLKNIHLFICHQVNCCYFVQGNFYNNGLCCELYNQISILLGMGYNLVVGSLQLLSISTCESQNGVEQDIFLDTAHATK